MKHWLSLHLACLSIGTMEAQPCPQKAARLSRDLGAAGPQFETTIKDHSLI